jgi:hypothetical protein
MKTGVLVLVCFAIAQSATMFGQEFRGDIFQRMSGTSPCKVELRAMAASPFNHPVFNGPTLSPASPAIFPATPSTEPPR